MSSGAYQIQRVKLKDLAQFCASEKYQCLPQIPLSTNRMKSYLHNPHGHKDDTVLYLTWNEEELIAYKVIFAGRFVWNQEEVRFGWLSGSYTAEDYRRRGLSSQLLEEIYVDWDQRILFTNAAPASLKLYNKSSHFKQLKVLSGHRYYLRSCLRTILPARFSFFKSLQPLLSMVDSVNNALLSLRPQQGQSIDGEETTYHQIENLKASNIAAYMSYRQGALLRDAAEHQWITDYPWIKSDKQSKKEAQRYQFSTYAQSFKTQYYSITKAEVIIGIMIVRIRDNHLSVPYAYLETSAIDCSIELINKLCKKHKIDYLTLYHQQLDSKMSDQRNYIVKKSFNQIFMISKKLLEQYPGIVDTKIQSGDGDKVFV